MNNMINEFLSNSNAENEEELNEQLQEFIKKYNSGEIDYTNSIMDDAYEMLEEAQNTKSKNKAKKLAHDAYLMCPDCLDAIIYEATLEENSLNRSELIKEGLDFEKDRLEEEGYFTKENIGKFYGIFETRPYIRGLYRKADYLILEGKYSLAIDVCKEILRLNNNDNTGARYLLMALYTCFEDEKNLLDLYKKYPEENLEMLFPLMILYYKKENYKTAKEYLKRINKANPDFSNFYKKIIRKNPNVPEGYYAKGDSSEVIMYYNQYSFLTDTVYNIDDFILKNSK